eukprot:250719-Pleurochrysis_carterae.AAC.1
MGGGLPPSPNRRTAKIWEDVRQATTEAADGAASASSTASRASCVMTPFAVAPPPWASPSGFGVLAEPVARRSSLAASTRASSFARGEAAARAGASSTPARRSSRRSSIMTELTSETRAVGAAVSSRKSSSAMARTSATAGAGPRSAASVGTLVRIGSSRTREASM